MSKRISIPKQVKKTLRDEVGFGCPVPGCGDPYLNYYHFVPPIKLTPTHITPHKDPKGIIALCAHHHKKALAEGYTTKQLQAFKSNKLNAKNTQASLGWLKRDFLYIIGGKLFYETPIPVQIDGIDVVSFKRDDAGYQRLNINMLSLSPEERVIVTDNDWDNIGTPLELHSCHQGKELEISYHNGDYLYLRFCGVSDAIELKAKFHISDQVSAEFNFPITVVEINLAIDATNIHLSSSGSLPLGLSSKHPLVSHREVGLSLVTGLHWQQNPKWELAQKYEMGRGNLIKVAFGK